MDCLSVGLLVADHLCAPIAHLPAAGELVVSDRLLLNIGGCASNAAMDLARLSVRVGVVGCVGKDVFGQFVGETLRSAGVGTEHVRVRPDVDTSGTLIVNVAGEDRRFIHSRGANAVLTAADIPLDALAQARVLYVGGYVLMPAMLPDDLARVFRHARLLGVKTVLDVVMPGPGDYWSWFDRLLPETDVFLPNTDEAALITGRDDPRDQALQFFDAGAGTVVVTCGGAGTVLVSRGLRLRAEAHRVPCVGATGAGDAFDAGYIAGMLDGGDMPTCLAWGSALGASCVRALGATEGVFTRDEALAFMREHPLRIETW